MCFCWHLLPRDWAAILYSDRSFWPIRVIQMGVARAVDISRALCLLRPILTSTFPFRREVLRSQDSCLHIGEQIQNVLCMFQIYGPKSLLFPTDGTLPCVSIYLAKWCTHVGLRAECNSWLQHAFPLCTVCQWWTVPVHFRCKTFPTVFMCDNCGRSGPLFLCILQGKLNILTWVCPFKGQLWTLVDLNPM